MLLIREEQTWQEIINLGRTSRKVSLIPDFNRIRMCQKIVAKNSENKFHKIYPAEMALVFIYEKNEAMNNIHLWRESKYRS